MQVFAPRVTRDEPSQALLLAAHERMLMRVGLPDCDATPPTRSTKSTSSTLSTHTYTSNELLALADNLAHALTLLERRRAAIAASMRAWGAAPKPRPGPCSNLILNLNSKPDFVVDTPARGAEGKEEEGPRRMRSSRAAVRPGARRRWELRRALVQAGRRNEVRSAAAVTAPGAALGVEVIAEYLGPTTQG